MIIQFFFLFIFHTTYFRFKRLRGLESILSKGQSVLSGFTKTSFTDAVKEFMNCISNFTAIAKVNREFVRPCANARATFYFNLIPEFIENKPLFR